MTSSLGSLVEENLRLHALLRDGNGPLCTKPWVSFEERSALGDVKPCCWFKGAIGQIRDGSDIEAVWRGERYRSARQGMSGGGLPIECPQDCPVVNARSQWFEKVELHEYSRAELASFDDDFLGNRAAVMRAILNGDATGAGIFPLRLHAHPSDVCNLRCVMCFLDLDSGRKRDWYAGPHLPLLMRYLEDFKIFGGEPFFCETSRALILDPHKPRWVHTSFVTNGTLVTDRVIEGLEAVRIGSVDVSLDAADAATYERIRLRGNFDKALAGARRLVDLAERHSIRRFPVYADFVIQELNAGEIVPFVRLCADTGLIANFTLCGDNPEAPRRAQKQQTALGVRPSDRLSLSRSIADATCHADGLGLSFTAASLRNVARQLEQR